MDPSINIGFKAILDLTLTQNDNSILPPDYMEKHMLATSRYFHLKIDEKTIEPATVTHLTKQSKIRFTFNLESTIEDKVEVKIYSLEGQFTDKYSVVSGPNIVTIALNPIISEDEIDSTKEQGALIGSLNTYTAGAADYGSLVASFINFDQSGIMIKFSQMSKLLSRFRMLNINFGVLLNLYFTQAALKYDPPSDKSPGWIYSKSTGHK